MEQRLILLQNADELSRAAALFDGWQETLIWSALEGVMGRIWTVRSHPQAALCENADFLFLAGDPALPETRELLEAWREEKRQYVILTPRTSAASQLIESVFGSRASRCERFAFQKGGESFDREKLKRMTECLPPQAELRPIDRELYHQALQSDWSRDFISQFLNAEDYLSRGLGFAAVVGGDMVGGASSYTCYSKGIEVQVETRADWQRRGIASACCAKLILTCLERGLYPSWDAANAQSAALAQKLGYVPAGTYPVWEIEC